MGPWILGFVVLAGLAGMAGRWWLFGLAFAAVVTWVVNLANLSFDAETIALVPVIPFLPRQTFRLSDLGPFAALNYIADWGAPAKRVRTEIVTGRSFRILYLFPSRRLTLQAIYGNGYMAKPFSAPELAALLETFRVNPPRL
jgi:hypothetical protein